MKKTIIRLSLAGMLLMNIAGLALAQAPKADKDTVNADKAAKPVFYQAAEEENTSKKGGNTALYIAIGVALGIGVGFRLMKKKKKD